MAPTKELSFLLFLLSSLDTTHALRINISVQYVSIAENTPLNTVLFTLTVTGGNNARVECADEQTSALVRLNHNGSTSYDVLVKGQLDREVASSSKLNFRASDSDGNSVTASMTMYLSDVNDNSPTFQHIPYLWELYENPGDVQTICTPNCSTFSVSATDPDRGNNATVRYSMESEERKTEYSETFRIDNKTGLVTQVKTINYEHNSYYQFVIYAIDLGSPPMTSNTSLIIQIKDVQDKAPFYTGIPYRATIDENLPTGSVVVTVNAQDGDPDVSNKVNYTIVNGPCTNLFAIGAETGRITTKQNIDRDTGVVKAVSGVCTLTVMAQEISGNENQYGNTTATTDVTVMIADIDDNIPTFNADFYKASVQENAPYNIPITIDSRSIIAYDNDTRYNAQFRLTIKYADGSVCTDFVPWPNTVESEQTILIRVRNPSILDYEARHNFTLLLVATEVAIASFERTSTIFLALTDVNDNNPIFPKDKYDLQLNENTPNFTLSGRITATDRDSDKNLTYTLSGGDDRFFFDHMTGEIRTLCSDCSTTFDRETQDMFYLTYVVTDSGGRSDSVPLEVHLLDVNDNAPLFDRDYSASIRENDDTYIKTPIVQFQARDIDLKGTDNSLISYSIRNISQPALARIFTLNTTTGELFLADPLDYEALNGNRVTITVIATDGGLPQLTSIANVAIDIQDENDNAPEFVGGPFVGTILEDQTSNTSYNAFVGKVTVTDKDGTAPNNQFYYYITNGADKKFSIDSTTGLVSVQLNARLDRETTPNYTLTIMVIDRGASPKSATSEMTISVKDVNDEKPRFVKSEYFADVMKNGSKGDAVVECVATDPDLDSSLQYKTTRVTAFDEDGLPIDANSIQNYLIINETTGMVTLDGDIDGITVKNVTLYIMVTDTNASLATKPQTDTATVRITLHNVNGNNPYPHTPTVITTITPGYQTQGPIVTDVPIDTTVKIYKGEGMTIQAPPAITVSEYASLGTLLGVVTISDIHGRVTVYPVDDRTRSLVDLQPVQFASIGGTSTSTQYKLVLKANLDREQEAYIQLRFSVVNAILQKMDFQVTLYVVDENDNSPIFDNLQYVFNVTSTVTPGSIVGVVRATDIDNGVNGVVSYTLQTNPGISSIFAINSASGQIAIYERPEFYISQLSFVVRATDAGNLPLYSNTMVTVTFQ